MNSSAASTLREARLRAALTQTELADLAGVAQSVVSAYESGKREPGYDTLRRLVSAAGFDLATTLTASTPKSRLQTLVDRHRAKLIRELRAQGASNIRLFGSVARGEDRPDSDVDLLVDVDNCGLRQSESSALLSMLCPPTV
jgi:transcriptional regulator with XRE-family HTH domain